MNHKDNFVQYVDRYYEELIIAMKNWKTWKQIFIGNHTSNFVIFCQEVHKWRTLRKQITDKWYFRQKVVKSPPHVDIGYFIYTKLIATQKATCHIVLICVNFYGITKPAFVITAFHFIMWL